MCFNLQRNGTGNGLFDIKDTSTGSSKLQVSVPHQSMCIFKTGRSSLSDGWPKYKEKVLDVPGNFIATRHKKAIMAVI